MITNHSKCNICKKKLHKRYAQIDNKRWCIKCFYQSGASLPIQNYERYKSFR